MIKIDDKSEKVDVFFPKTLTDMELPLSLVLFNGKNQEYTIEITDELGYFKNFYCFNIDFSFIPNGEYRYTLSDGILKEDGLMRIGEIKSTTIENKIENTIKQYGE